MRRWWQVVTVVYFKELGDILRDRRALLTVGVVAILSGPVMLLMLANMLAGFEARAERRIVLVQGIEHAPTLRNYLERETVKIETPPEDYIDRLRLGRLPDPVLIIPPDFEQVLAQNAVPRLTIMTDSTNGRADAGVARLQRWISGFSLQRAGLEMAMRSVAGTGYGRMEVEEHDLAGPLAQSTRVFGMLPFFFALAALYGVWGAALDTTVGERERGTLQPLLLTPAGGFALVVGKWLAVSSVGAGMVSTAILGFIPAQAVMPGETLKAMLAFGGHESLMAIAMFVPMAGLFAALLMLAGARARSFKQAQASATGLLLAATMLPLLVGSSDSGVAHWHAFAPVLAQHVQMRALLSGDPVTWPGVLAGHLVTMLLVLPLLWWTSRCLSRQQVHRA